MNNEILNTTMLHGADYNPDQWLDQPEILNEDIRLMKLAHINCVSMAIFAWSKLEPEEGNYQFDWLAEIIDKLYENNIYTLLATPSGGRPAWMAKKYPEVLRVSSDLTRNLMGARHNHCYTSPVYRKKVYDMNYRMAERFGDHPAVLMWHISNEYSGECFCPMCQQEFRNWLQNKYKTLDALNQAWWNTFWSHTYTDWSEIEAPVPKGELRVHGLNLDWKRFVTDRTVDFCKWEISAVRDAGSKLPTTVNLMGFYDTLNYFKFKDVIDIVSWDNYPEWHVDKDDTDIAVESAATHDLMRSIKKKPFLLMESTPSAVNWRTVAKLKRPDMHMLSSMQAIAHGSNSVQYFQWRKSRGSFEKFHGAVVDHYGKEDTRVFHDVADVGKRMEHLGELCSTNVKSEVAIIYDWENGWAYKDAAGPHKPNKLYKTTVLKHYRAFWNMGISVDFVDMEEDIRGYKLVIAPLLYLYRAGIEEKFKNFVENGGTLVGTYWSGIVNDTDLCYTGGMPGGGMMEVFGLRSEEIDALCENDCNKMEWNGRTYHLHNLCDLVVINTAEILACYQQDFYKGKAALLKNSYGTGSAYYLAADAEAIFYDDFYSQLSDGLHIKQSIKAELPYGVTANIRKEKREIVIVQNYNPYAVEITIDERLMDVENAEQVKETLKLAAYEAKFLIKK